MVLKSGKIKNTMFTPVTYKSDKIGIIRVSNKLDESQEVSGIGFTQEDLDLLVSLGEQVSVALANSRLYQDRVFQLDGIEALNRVISKITSAADLDEIYEAVKQTKATLPAIDEMCLLIKKDDGFESIITGSDKEILGCRSCLLQKIKCMRQDGDSLVSYYCPDVGNDPFFKNTGRKGLKSKFVIPLVFKDELLGILDIGSKISDVFSDFEQKLLRSLGSQVAIAINNRIKQEKQLEIFKDISHSLGTYLTTMRSYTQRIIDGKVKDEKKEEYLKILLGDVLSMANSVDEISSLAKMEFWDDASTVDRVDIMEIVAPVL